MTPRFVLMLVGQLTEGSAFSASIQGGPKYRAWTLQNHLLASTVNMLYAANRQRGGKSTKTLPINPPKPSSRSRPQRGRMVDLSKLPSARRVAGR